MDNRIYTMGRLVDDKIDLETLTTGDLSRSIVDIYDLRFDLINKGDREIITESDMIFQLVSLEEKHIRVIKMSKNYSLWVKRFR